MSKSNTTENDLMLLINKTLPSYLGTLSGTGNTDLYISLHTADPGEGGSQTTSEATYTGYTRVAVVRTSAGWTVSGNQAENAALIQFGLCAAGSDNYYICSSRYVSFWCWSDIIFWSVK